MEFQKLEKGAKGCMAITNWIVAICAIAVASGIVFISGLWEAYLFVKILYVAVVVFTIIEALVAPKFRYERYRYRIDEEAIDIREGFLFVSENIVPIERVQNLQISQGPIDRHFGVAKVQVTTGGGSVVLRFIAKEKAEMISDALKKRVNEAAIKEKEQQQEG